MTFSNYFQMKCYLKKILIRNIGVKNMYDAKNWKVAMINDF